MNNLDILALMRTVDGEITTAEVADAMGITYTSAYLKLVSLRRNGLVEHIGDRDTGVTWRATA